MSSHLRTLARYKAWANERLYDTVARLPSEELVAKRPIFAGNILRTLNHVHAMDLVWKAHLQGVPHGFKAR
ncbi:MAG: damage-inducible protein DinB, partial [Betaproteobacteria bacterium]|nr:damage-inducible protein DinB [Betaproteobacteria bacterium]